jgi:glycine cleavage system aminomethyltransferase T
VARGVGEIRYTQMCNSRGGIECDFTVTRVDEDLFSIAAEPLFDPRGERVRGAPVSA